jgi:hypothetical protein
MTIEQIPWQQCTMNQIAEKRTNKYKIRHVQFLKLLIWGHKSFDEVHELKKHWLLDSPRKVYTVAFIRNNLFTNKASSVTLWWKQ